MSISFPIVFDGYDEAFIFTIDDDGGLIVDDERFEDELIATEMGFEMHDIVCYYNEYMNRPLELLIDQGIVSDRDMLLIAITIIERYSDLFYGLFPRLERDMPYYYGIANNTKDEIRPSWQVGYLHTDPESEGGWSPRKFVLYALWILRDMAESFVIPRYRMGFGNFAIQLRQFINHTGRAIAHKSHPTKKPIQILKERDAAIESVFYFAIKSIEQLVFSGKVVENFRDLGFDRLERSNG